MKPDGWQDCPNTAVALVENIFFAFKTPFNGGDFGIQSVFDYAKAQNWDIGLWIDLTNTKRYYNPQQVEKKGVKYVKFAMVGRTSPTRYEVDYFIKQCNEFLSQHPHKVIGVHCTHGFNRTGFLICSFLSKVLGIDAHAALVKFAESRPPGIYRQNMVDDFIHGFGSWRSPPPPRVTNPPWKEGPSPSKGNKGSSSRGTPKKDGTSQRSLEFKPNGVRKPVNSALTLESLFEEIEVEKQQAVLQLVKVLLQKFRSTGYPGHGYQHLTEANLDRIKRSRYMVARQPQEFFPYLLHLDEKGDVYAISGNNAVFAVPMLEFRDATSPSGKLFSTIMEGIFVRRKRSDRANDKDAGNDVITFEMNDIYVYKGSSLRSENLHSKLKFLQRILNSRKPRGDSRNHRRADESDLFQLDVQPMWDVNDFTQLQRFDWFRNYQVGPNGLLFFPVDTAHPNQPFFKWIAPHTSTAHFRISAKSSAAGSADSAITPCYTLTVDDSDTPVAEIEDPAVSSAMLSKIVECEFLLAEGQKRWSFKREAHRRIWTDSSAFVSSIWSGQLSANLPKNELFSSLGASLAGPNSSSQPRSRDYPPRNKPSGDPSTIRNLELDFKGTDDSHKTKKTRLDFTEGVNVR